MAQRMQRHRAGGRRCEGTEGLRGGLLQRSHQPCAIDVRVAVEELGERDRVAHLDRATSELVGGHYTHGHEA